MKDVSLESFTWYTCHLRGQYIHNLLYILAKY